MKFMELWVGIDNQATKESFCAILAKEVVTILGAIPHERKSTLIMLYFEEKNYNYEIIQRQVIQLCKKHHAYFMQLGETRRHFP